MSIINLS